MAVSCISSEIKRDIGRKSWFFHTPLHSTPPFRGFPSEYCHPVLCGKTRMVGLPNGVKTLRICNHLDAILACDGRTDRRTERQTSCHGIIRAMHTRRAVKIAIFDNISLYLGNDTRQGHNYHSQQFSYIFYEVRVVVRSKLNVIYMISWQLYVIFFTF